MASRKPAVAYSPVSSSPLARGNREPRGVALALFCGFGMLCVGLTPSLPATIAMAASLSFLCGLAAWAAVAEARHGELAANRVSILRHCGPLLLATLLWLAIGLADRLAVSGASAFLTALTMFVGLVAGEGAISILVLKAIDRWQRGADSSAAAVLAEGKYIGIAATLRP